MDPLSRYIRDKFVPNLWTQIKKAPLNNGGLVICRQDNGLTPWSDPFDRDRTNLKPSCIKRQHDVRVQSDERLFPRYTRTLDTLLSARYTFSKKAHILNERTSINAIQKRQRFTWITTEFLLLTCFCEIRWENPSATQNAANGSFGWFLWMFIYSPVGKINLVLIVMHKKFT